MVVELRGTAPKHEFSESDAMSALGDVIVDALRQLLRTLFSPIEGVIETYGPDVIKTVVGTPHPDAVFQQPTNGVWPRLYEYYWDSIIPLALLLWALAIGLVIFFESTSYLFSSYHRTKLKKRAFSGLLGILLWWWIAAFSLRLIEALTGFLVPDLSSISLFQTLSFSALGVLGVVITMATDLILFALIAILYFMRYIVLYLFVLLMPLLIAFWIPGVGPFRLVSGFVKRLAGFYVPFLFMVIPVALLFRLGQLLGNSLTANLNGITLWLTALVIPIVAVVSPFILFWQAGALYFTLDRASHRMSAQRTRARAGQAKSVGKSGVQHTQNFARGVQGQGAIQQDGSVAFGSGDSRTNRAGHRLRSRVRATGTRLSESVTSASSSSDRDQQSEFQTLRGRMKQSISRSSDPSGNSTRTEETAQQRERKHAPTDEDNSEEHQ